MYVITEFYIGIPHFRECFSRDDNLAFVSEAKNGSIRDPLARRASLNSIRMKFQK